MIFETYFLRNNSQGILSPANYLQCKLSRAIRGASFLFHHVTSPQVLSVDGMPVTDMTRMECVKRLKESQLVIRLVVRCRGALRPEVVSAERKIERSKMPPELPAAPPPVPPRKLKQLRGPADGEANPSPVRKSWDGSRSQNGSQNGSPAAQVASRECASAKITFESCESSSSPRSVNGSSQASPKGSPELTKSKQVIAMEN